MEIYQPGVSPAFRYRWTQARLLSAVLISTLLLLSVGSLAQGKAPLFARGRVLVKFRDGVSVEQQGNVLGRVGAKGARRLGNLKIHTVDLQAEGQEEDTVADLNDQPEVEFAELDRKLKADQASGEPGYANQWFLPNVQADMAWTITTGSSSIIVAILDSGCDPTHPDLAPNYVAGWNFTDSNTNTQDVYGHGTAVAGCVGAVGSNGIGIASVSWNSRIMPIRVTDTSGNAYVSSLANGLQWAADHGAKIANMSFGGILGSSTILNAAQYFYSKGGLVCASAGNTGTDPGYAANPYVITVSATTSANTLASWSSYGGCVTVSAPGDNIYTTNNGGTYAYWSGTSFSSPLVCGVLADIWAANPSLSNAQVRNILQNSADDLGSTGWDSSFGYGKVNTYRAVVLAKNTAVDTTAPLVSITSPAGGSSVMGQVAISTTASDDTGVSRVEMYVDGVLMATDTAAPYNFVWNTSGVTNGTHTLTAKAYDANNNVGTSTTVSVNVMNPVDSTPPTAVITSPANNSRVNNSLSVSASATDNVAVRSLTLYVDGKAFSTVNAAQNTFSMNTRKWSAGAHTLQVVATDTSGNTGASAVVTVYR